VATIRSDGTPRISPMESFVLYGVLWLSMLWGSTKAADLQRDPRVLVHSVITSRDANSSAAEQPQPASVILNPPLRSW
jgi:hypothetical protein